MTTPIPPTNEREYTLWRALQLAPRPLPRHSGDVAPLYGRQMGWEEVDWIREYANWFKDIRMVAMKEAPLGPESIQLLAKQLENDRLRALLVEIRDQIDHAPLIRAIDEEMRTLDNDIEL